MPRATASRCKGYDFKGWGDTPDTGATAAEYSGSIFLDHNVITTGDDIQFSIQREDESDNDGKRPGAVTLVLYADEIKVKGYPTALVQLYTDSVPLEGEEYSHLLSGNSVADTFWDTPVSPPPAFTQQRVEPSTPGRSGD